MEVLLDNLLYSKHIDFNKKELVKVCLDFEIFLKLKLSGIDQKTKLGCFTTSNFSFYNIFSYHHIEFNNLYNNLRKIIKPILDEENYVIQCWLNVLRKDQFLDWHGHWNSGYKSYHGYFCIDVKDSITSYKFTNIEYDVINQDGLIVLGRSKNDLHRTSNWNYDTPRITIAFDIIPLSTLNISKYNEHFVVF